MSPARAATLRWVAQRVSATLLALCVVVHLATMIYAVRHGLTGAAVLARVRGHSLWPAFYVVFVAAVAVHAPLGLRVVLDEWSQLRGRYVDLALAAFGLLLLVSGLRAVYAVSIG
jgi:fumarate reductase subunit C